MLVEVCKSVATMFSGQSGSEVSIHNVRWSSWRTCFKTDRH